MAYASFEALLDVFSDHMISHGQWPPSFLDLTPCYFYLCRSLKDKVYKTNSHILEERRNNIHYKISEISGEEIQRVNTSLFHRYNECIQSEGKVFSICCSTDKFLLHFLKAILTVVTYHWDLHHLRLPSPTATHAWPRQAVLRWPQAWPLFVGKMGNGPICTWIYKLLLI